MGEISKIRKRKLFVLSNGQCMYCGKVLTAETFQIEHILPVSLGGKNNADNLGIACRLCNSRKKNRMIEQWRRYMIERITSKIYDIVENGTDYMGAYLIKNFDRQLVLKKTEELIALFENAKIEFYFENEEEVK